MLARSAGLGGGCPGKASLWRAASSNTLEVVRERAVEMAEGRALRQREQHVQRPRASARLGLRGASD